MDSKCCNDKNCLCIWDKIYKQESENYEVIDGEYVKIIKEIA
jgi:hypothetical protein